MQNKNNCMLGAIQELDSGCWEVLYGHSNSSESLRIWGNLSLVSREWRNGSNRSYNCTPFLHSLLTKGKVRGEGLGV